MPFRKSIVTNAEESQPSMVGLVRGCKTGGRTRGRRMGGCRDEGAKLTGKVAPGLNSMFNYRVFRGQNKTLGRIDYIPEKQRDGTRGFAGGSRSQRVQLKKQRRVQQVGCAILLRGCQGLLLIRSSCLAAAPAGRTESRRSGVRSQ